MTSFNYIKNVTTLKFNELKCVGCGMCVTVCPHRVFQLTGKKATLINKDKCMECGACELNCVANAIQVKRGVGCATAVLNSYFNNGNVSCGCDSACCN